jgi:hypothetical protein
MSEFIDSMMPAWCEPGTRPEWLRAIDGGDVCSWTRDVGPSVSLCREDILERGGVRCGPTVIRVSPDAADAGMDPGGARELAGELLAAAELAENPHSHLPAHTAF